MSTKLLTSEVVEKLDLDVFELCQGFMEYELEVWEKVLAVKTKKLRTEKMCHER